MFKIGEIRELIRLLDETSLAELKIEMDDMKLHMKKAEAVAPVVPSTAALLQQPAAAQQTVAPAPISNPEPTISQAIPVVKEEENIHLISSPMVGTFYRASSPDAAAYVEAGSKVTTKSIVCIVEAMKLMNEIEAEVSGEVVEILAENGQLVEYGQPLFKIRLS